MTQVQEWSNERLNIALSKLMGRTELTAVVVNYDMIAKYCEDPAASLEVQAKAGAIDPEGYSHNLQLIKWGRTLPRISGKAAFELMNARGEIAYVLLTQGAGGEDTAGDTQD
ncbi:hypothetical protein D3C75_463470 [compost metagenome]